MYSAWVPLLRQKFWKKEFVGRGEERRLGEKKREGSGTTVDCARGKTNGEVRWCFCDMIGSAGGREDGISEGRGWGI